MPRLIQQIGREQIETKNEWHDRHTFEQLSHLKMVPRCLPFPPLALVTLMPAPCISAVPASSSSSAPAPVPGREWLQAMGMGCDGDGVPAPGLESESVASEESAAAAVWIVTGLHQEETQIELVQAVRLVKRAK